MTGERKCPVVPRADLDVALDFDRVLVVEVRFSQRRPNSYAATKTSAMCRVSGSSGRSRLCRAIAGMFAGPASCRLQGVVLHGAWPGPWHPEG